MWGAANTQLNRLMPADYLDGIGDVLIEPPMRENPRVISNAVVAQPGPMPNTRGLTNFVWQWGQFLDHDVDLTEGSDANGTAPIPVPRRRHLGPDAHLLQSVKTSMPLPARELVIRDSRSTRSRLTLMDRPSTVPIKFAPTGCVR